MREWKRSTPIWLIIATSVLWLVFAWPQPVHADELDVVSPALIDSFEVYEALLLKDIEFWKAEADSLRLQVAIEEVNCAELEANQRRWYDRVVWLGEMLAVGLALKWVAGQ